jgi:dihydroflavonol-4-reductase
MKPLLVTGATGFLGKHLVGLLLEKGAAVRVLCRGVSPWEGNKRVETVKGDNTSSSDVDRAVKGCARIFHLAGVVSRKPEDAELLRQVHVEGTRFVLDAAARHGVERVVHASTSGTVAVSRKAVVLNETAGYREREASHWPYYLTKIEAEKLALNYASGKRNLAVVVINPSLLLGPGDDRGSSTGDIAALLAGKVMSLPTGGMNFVDVRDCASAAVAAMERGRPGERYLIGGENWTLKRVAEEVGRLSGVAMPKMTSPTWLSLLAAPVLRKLMPLFGKSFDIDDATIEMSGVFWYCDSAKAAKELGFSARPGAETIRDTIADIRAREARG